jgi:hypothetical protein
MLLSGDAQQIANNNSTAGRYENGINKGGLLMVAFLSLMPPRYGLLGKAMGVWFGSSLRPQTSIINPVNGFFRQNTMRFPDRFFHGNRRSKTGIQLLPSGICH